MAEGTQQSRVAMGFTGVFAGGSAPRNSHLFPPEHLSRLGFPHSSGEVHLLSLRPCCWPQPCLLSRLSFRAEKWKIQNSSLRHNFTFLFFPPLLGTAEPPWQLVYAWPCISPVGNVKNTSYNFPFPHTKIY